MMDSGKRSGRLVADTKIIWTSSLSKSSLIFFRKTSKVEDDELPSSDEVDPVCNMQSISSKRITVGLTLSANSNNPLIAFSVSPAK